MENHLKAGPKDVFLQLLSIITLYVSVWALIDLLFQFVNLAFPDALAGDYWQVQSVQYSLRRAISILIIVFPAYLIVNWLLGKSYTAVPERKNLRIRKWLVYLTLFLSAIVLIIDLVVLVNNLLSGDLTTAFILKVLAVLVVIGGVFLYYLWDIRKQSAD
jgi:hypothetical protein